MRKVSKRRQRGFTLIELMIVVAIIGILAVLAVFGVRKYLANAKTGEARNNIGQINQLAINAYEMESASPELIALGGVSANNIHQLCTAAAVVPAAVPANKKYQPNPTPGQDFQTGTATAGWKCLKFEVSQPINYQYAYNNGAVGIGTGASGHATIPAAASWTVEADGDLNGDGTTSSFMTGGQITGVANGNEAVPFSQIAELNPEE